MLEQVRRPCSTFLEVFRKVRKSVFSALFQKSVFSNGQARHPRAEKTHFSHFSNYRAPRIDVQNRSFLIKLKRCATRVLAWTRRSTRVPWLPDCPRSEQPGSPTLTTRSLTDKFTGARVHGAIRRLLKTFSWRYGPFRSMALTALTYWVYRAGCTQGCTGVCTQGCTGGIQGGAHLPGHRFLSFSQFS